jgi:hypothetical protein
MNRSCSTLHRMFRCPVGTIRSSTVRESLAHPKLASHSNRTSTPASTMSVLNTNVTVMAYPTLDLATASAIIASDSDSNGTVIFGVIASILALMAIIIGILQLRKTKGHRQTDERV